MKILDPMPAEVRTEIKSEIRSHTEVLRELLSTSGGLARKYLLFTNAGAAVALMAFMGNNEHVRSSSVAWASLGLFAFGVIACGVLTALDYHIQLGSFQLWLRECGRFFGNEIDLEALYGSLNAGIKKKGSWPVVAGYAAFACFVVGTSISFVAFLGHPPAALSPEQLFAEQTSCGASTRDWFTKFHAKDEPAPDSADSLDYASHYNQKLNQCFAVLTSSNPTYVTIKVFDVNENSQIGIYMKEFREKQLARCEIGGTLCHSDKEWSRLAEPYFSG